MESHFWYNKRQRMGILFMAFVLAAIQVFLHFSDNFLASHEEVYDPVLLEQMNARLDSMIGEQESENQEIYPFNPNYISDFKGYVLGLSTDEIDRLLAYRKKGLFMNSADDFQRVTGVSDSLLRSIEPYFKFPSFARKTRIRNSMPETNDLNLASAEDFMKIQGVGETLSQRIVSYRKFLGGYAFEDQVFEVYNLPRETAQRVLERFEVREPPEIKKINVNTAGFKEILSLPYIDYDLTRRIMDFRKEEKVITDLSDLKKIDSFPLDKFERIAVYLLAE